MKTQKETLEVVTFSINHQEILNDNQMKSVMGGDNEPPAQDPKIFIKE